MKTRAKLLISIVSLFVTVYTASAQEPQTSENIEQATSTTIVQSGVTFVGDTPDFTMTTANKLRVERGQRVANVGKTLMISGGGVALTSTLFYALANAQWERNYDPDSTIIETPIFPIFTLAGYAAGAIFALVGLPIYFAGRDIVVSNDGQFITMGGNAKGVATMVDLGIGIPNFVSLDAVYGYNFTPNFFVGGGVGGKMWLTAGLAHDGAIASLPIYGQMRYTLTNKRIAPYAALSGGYDVVVGAPYLGVDFGTRIRSARTVDSSYGDTVERDNSWWISSKLGYICDENFFLSIGIAKSF